MTAVAGGPGYWAVVRLLLLRPGGPTWRSRAARAAACIAGGALPVVVAALLYWHAGALGLWWSASVASNFRRVGGAVPPGAFGYAARLELVRLGPLFGFDLLVLAAAGWRLARRRRWEVPDQVGLFLAVWLVGGSLGVAAAKSFYDHYFLQLLPVLCVTFGWGAGFLLDWRGPRPALRRSAIWLGAAVVLALPAATGTVALQRAAAPVLALQGWRFMIRPDPPLLIAHDLAPALGAGTGGIYVFDGQPILYSLLRRQPPTRYVFPSVLTTTFLAHVAGVDAPAELARILAGRPLFIIRSLTSTANPDLVNRQVYALMDAALAANYRLWRLYPGTAVYRRR